MDQTTIALIGANGMLSSAVKRLSPSGYTILCYGPPEFDLTAREQVLALKKKGPQIILNCAAYTNVDGCESDCQRAMQVNGEGPGLLAELAKEIGAVLVHISTDFVFEGAGEVPYRETDSTGPLSVYGKSKLLGEKKILQSGLEKYFIIRTSWLYGSNGNNFVETMIRLAKELREIKVVEDQRGTPTWTDDLARAIFSLLQTKQYGVYHFSDKGDCSWYQFAVEIINQVRNFENLKVENVRAIPTEGYPLPAQRPKYSVLSKQKIIKTLGLEIPTWQESLREYLKQRTYNGLNDNEY